MDTVVKKLYEGMFLVDSALAASDWDGVNDAVKTVLDRSEAEVVSLKKWDERNELKSRVETGKQRLAEVEGELKSRENRYCSSKGSGATGW